MIQIFLAWWLLAFALGSAGIVGLRWMLCRLYPQRVLVRACRSVADCEFYCNRMAKGYRVVGLADTDAYITVVLQRRWF